MSDRREWDGVRVCVTGGEGFIGSHLVERLVREGASVRVLALYNPFGRYGWLDPEVHRDVEVLPGDVRDPERVFQAVDGTDVVFHLAALIGIPYSYVAPTSYVQVNVEGTVNVAEACRRAGVRRMVHTSTSETYGTAITVPIAESHPMQPQSPYSASKIGADNMALSYHHAFELPVAIVRPFNTYGPRQSTRAVIPTILGQLHRGAKQIELGATSPTRDFTFVEDTAAGFLAVAGCDRAVGDSKVVELRFWNSFTGPDGRTMLAIIKKFNADHPDVHVTMQRMEAGPYYNKLFVAGLGGRAPEIFVSHVHA
ncbi:MAG: hypothetical protein QOD30_451, partial [Actinomycetota bacterium]|nr:hypothetical protein [Actinomycetota bacterium]